MKINSGEKMTGSVGFYRRTPRLARVVRTKVKKKRKDGTAKKVKYELASPSLFKSFFQVFLSVLGLVQLAFARILKFQSK